MCVPRRGSRSRRGSSDAGRIWVTRAAEKLPATKRGGRWESTPVPADVAVVIVMGVAGSGKTTVGTALAAALGWRFVDADDQHSPASIAKMARGEALDDADRWPWLDRLRAIIGGAVVAADTGERAV